MQLIFLRVRELSENYAIVQESRILPNDMEEKYMLFVTVRRIEYRGIIFYNESIFLRQSACGTVVNTCEFFPRKEGVSLRNSL